MYYVYKITNNVNGKVYIGKTSNIDDRFNQHIKMAQKPNDRAHSLIHKAIAKYGKENFIIETVECLDTELECFELEKYWINFYKCNASRYGDDSGYNLTDGGEGAGGYKFSDEQKRKLSKSNSGKLNGFYGKRHSNEIKKSISNSLILYFEENDNPFKGGKHSDASKIKMSNSHTGIQAGERHPMSKLSDIDIQSIFQMIVAGKKDNEISLSFCVDRKIISNIRRGKSWKHILRPPELTEDFTKSKRKITANDVSDILLSIKEGVDDQSIATKLSVSKSTIRRIRLGEGWKKVPRLEQK